MTKLSFTLSVAFVFAVSILSGSGCSSLSGLSLPSWSETSSPKEIAAFWDTIIRTEGEQVYRGFAAKVMFYDSGSKKGMRVKGNFDVYIFDEAATGKAAVVPVKIVRYQMGDLKALESDSKMLGKSYTLWVPWDELTPDSDEKKLSLFVRFKCDDGTIVMSKQATITLPASPEKVAEQADIHTENQFTDNMLRQTALLAKLSEQQKNNPNSLDTEWNGTVAEHVITREARPQAMLTTTITKPGFSRDGVQNVTSERKYASVADEQKYREAQTLIANAQIAKNAQTNQAASNDFANWTQQQPVQNPNYPVNQVQFQSSPVENGQTLRPAFDGTSRGFAPAGDEASYREFLQWKQQQQQQSAPQQPLPQNNPQAMLQGSMQPAAQPATAQPAYGNYAAANTGAVWR